MIKRNKQVSYLFQNKFPKLFQDFSRTRIDFSRTLKFTLTLSPSRWQCYFSLLSAIHFFFFLEFNRFPALSRTSSVFPGLSSPGKWHNKILKYHLWLLKWNRTIDCPGTFQPNVLDTFSATRVEKTQKFCKECKGLFSAFATQKCCCFWKPISSSIQYDTQRTNNFTRY